MHRHVQNYKLFGRGFSVQIPCLFRSRRTWTSPSALDLGLSRSSPHSAPAPWARSTARRANQGQLGIILANETSTESRGATWQYLSLQLIAGLMVAGTLGLLSDLPLEAASRAAPDEYCRCDED